MGTSISSIERISNLLSRSLTGSLSPEETQELEKWRAESPENEEVFKRLSDSSFLEDEYAKWRSVDIVRPYENMADMLSRENRRKSFIARAGVAAAAVFLLVASLVALHRSEDKYDTLLREYQTDKYMSTIHSGQTKARLITDDGKIVVLGSDDANNDEVLKSISAQTGRRDVALNNLEIPRGGEFHIILEDGTNVWLNAESSLKYPEHFGSGGREVELTGEAYFQVAKDPARPFSVKLDGQVICVHGTEFNVMSYGDDSCVYTTLVSGSLSVRQETSNGSELILTPGHQAVFSRSDATTSVRQINAEAVSSWRNGMFVFEDQTLDQIMRQLSRWYDFSYEFADEDVASTVFMGKVPRYGTFGDVLDILEKSGNLRFKADRNTIIISNK